MMNQITIVSTKGQLVIPAEMRVSLGITPGTRMTIRQEGSRIVLEPVSKKLINKLRGITKGGLSMADELQKERRSDKW
jgi:AbrB family looped-hinge helix DNA binding protein